MAENFLYMYNILVPRWIVRWRAGDGFAPLEMAVIGWLVFRAAAEHFQRMNSLPFRLV